MRCTRVRDRTNACMPACRRQELRLCEGGWLIYVWSAAATFGSIPPSQLRACLKMFVTALERPDALAAPPGELDRQS